MEPPGAPPAARRSARTALNPRRLTVEPATALATAAGALVLAGRADVWVVAVLVACADRSAGPALIGACAGVFALDRFGSAGLADIAGTQSVLGEAGWHGSAGAIAATWLLAVALLLACRKPGASAVAGALGALLVAAPALNDGLAGALIRLCAISAGGGLGWLLAPRGASSRQLSVALVLAGIGVVVAFATV